MRLGMVLCLALRNSACLNSLLPPPLAPPPQPIPAECRSELMAPPVRPTPLPTTLTAREGLRTGAADRASTVSNANQVDSLQACISALLAQRRRE